MAKRDTSQLKWKKKKWVEILAPPTFKNVSLGETVTDDPQKIIGKVIQANMMNVIRNPKMQSITMRFKVTDLKDTKAHTQPISYTMAHSAIKRLVRSRRDRIDDSFVVITKDEQHVRVKPMVITQNNGTAIQRTGMRSLLRGALSTYASKHTFDEMITNVVEYKLQKETKKQLAVIIPIRTVEMRAFQVVDAAKEKDIVRVEA